MIRLERGFDSSLLDSDNDELNGYTEYHRLVMPKLIAFDMFRAQNPQSPLGRLGMVAAASIPVERDATLLLAAKKDDIVTATETSGWVELRSALQLSEATANDCWRILERCDPHHEYPGITTWSATRTMARLDTNAQRRSDGDVRLRERYTLTSTANVTADDVRLVVERGEYPSGYFDEIILATATVYAINKAVQKLEFNKGGNVANEDYPEIANLEKSWATPQDA